MSVGVSTPLPAYTIDPAFMAKKAEELGFESIWYAEHPAVPVESKQPLPGHRRGGTLDLLPFHRPLHRPGPRVGSHQHHQAGHRHHPRSPSATRCCWPRKSPASTASAAAASCLASALAGLREETEIFGGDFDHRWTQTREALEVMKELWTKDEAEYHGKYFNFPPVKSYPKPAQQPHPPIIIGGMARNVLRRVVSHADGWLPNRVPPAEVEDSRRRLDAMAAEVGRDPKSITISVYGQPADGDLVKSYLNAGAEPRGGAPRPRRQRLRDGQATGAHG